MQTFHRPDEAPFIRRFVELYPRIPALIDLFEARRDYKRKHRVFSSWVAWQDDGAGEIAMDYGTNLFYERFVRALEDAQQGIELVVKTHASEYEDQIEPIDEIGSCNDPDQLIRMYDGARLKSEYQADSLGRFEIARKLAIASQIMCIACADPYERVTNDLTETNMLASSRLFTRSKEQLAVGYVLDKDRYNRLHPDHPIRVSRDQTARFVWPEGVPGRQRVFGCRTIVDGDIVYEVQTDSRPKPRISGVFKLERGGKLTDRRGLKHIVIAVEENGVLRSAKQADAELVTELARERLWYSPLREEADVSGRNPYSSKDYWATKIVGRLESTEGRRTAAPVEYQVTSVDHDLNAKFATDDLGHGRYRQKVIRDFVLSQWFPFETFGIDWNREPTIVPAGKSKAT
ncbi:MAG: hypothetical protein AAB776_01135 [Patescibacteria group bacterium]